MREDKLTPLKNPGAPAPVADALTEKTEASQTSDTFRRR